MSLRTEDGGIYAFLPKSFSPLFDSTVLAPAHMGKNPQPSLLELKGTFIEEKSVFAISALRSITHASGRITKPEAFSGEHSDPLKRLYEEEKNDVLPLCIPIHFLGAYE
ncbi:hypothetical protein [Parasphaerochaeta coccoides]|uniref:hypothetical protein n=1 Tax=Parasphaerochaeta coccoides TaxID=273376 RepID=UPI0011D28648|nr:hypothetical protein [Parasphaerochaeta coccoides]